jgi:glycosyltransferase involved in cell wall biosynthesis
LKRVVLIGSLPSSNNKIITGPSVVLKTIYDHLRKKNINTTLINLFQKNDSGSRSVGKFSFKRSFFIFIKGIDFFKLPKVKNSTAYIFVSPSNVGLIRDLMFINIALIKSQRIILHQLGNYMDFFNSKSLPVKFLIKNFFNKANKIIVEGELVENFFKDRNFSDNFITIPNCAPPNLQIKSNNDHNDFRVLYLSNLIPSKGYLNLLKSLIFMDKNSRSNVLITFVGKFMDVKPEKVNGIKEKEFFFKYIKKHNLQNNVIYIESAWGKEKYDLYNNSDIFVLPSNYIYEMQPISIIEAMSCGLPIISTKIGLIPSMVEHNINGLILDETKPKNIANSILMLMKDSKMMSKMKAANIKKFKNNYSEEIFLESIDKFI